MNGAAIDPFDKKEGGEGQYDDEDRILYAAGRLLIGIDGHNEVDAKGRAVEVIDPLFPLLWILAIEGQHLPIGVEATVFYRSKIGQHAAGEAGIGPGGTGFGPGLASDGYEEEIAGPFETDGGGEFEGAIEGRDPGGERCAEGAFELIGGEFGGDEEKVGGGGARRADARCRARGGAGGRGRPGRGTCGGRVDVRGRVGRVCAVAGGCSEV